jgi:hypothetical protein
MRTLTSFFARLAIGRLICAITLCLVAPVAPAYAGPPPLYSGTSGPVAWEVTAIERNQKPDGSLIRWDYEIVLREREGVGIAFQTLISDAEGPRTATSVQRIEYARRLEPRGELRYQTYYWIQKAAGTSTSFDVMPGGRQGVRLLKRFEGRDDTGKPVRVDVRFSLDPSVGDQPAIRVDVSSLPPTRSLKPEELASLAGTWSGQLLDGSGITFALDLQVQPNGQFDATVGTVVKQHFQGNLAISTTGELEYSTRNATGRGSVHENGPQRVLIASASPKPGASSSAVAYSIRATFAPVAPSVSPQTAALPPPAQPPQVPTALAPDVDEILTNSSIVSLVQAGLDETVILAKIVASPARFDTRTEALIELKRAGVSDRILAAMIGKR